MSRTKRNKHRGGSIALRNRVLLDVCVLKRNLVMYLISMSDLSNVLSSAVHARRFATLKDFTIKKLVHLNLCPFINMPIPSAQCLIGRSIARDVQPRDVPCQPHPNKLQVTLCAPIRTGYGTHQLEGSMPTGRQRTAPVGRVEKRASASESSESMWWLDTLKR